MFATQVLPETLSENDTEDENKSDIVGLIVVDDKEYELKIGETKIGRDPSLCSIAIENFTVSKVHAIIESEGCDDTFIYDVGSTNQTKLGKKILKPHCRYKLDNNAKITLGNIIAKFVVPSDRGSNPDSNTSNHILVKFDAVEELGDIFDVPTQVSAIEPNTSNIIPVFEKSRNLDVFKVPNSVPPAKTSRLSKSVFEEETQCRLYSQETKSETACSDSSFENSSIFNATTQCQLYKSPSEKEAPSQENPSVDTNKNSESEKLKSLLNDGEDDILCTFMSLHSSGEQINVLNIKTEILDDVFDAPTQVQIEVPESVTEKEKKELDELLHNKDLLREFSTSDKPSVTSTPIHHRINQDSCLQQIEEEDFIATQEFNVSSEATKRKDAPQIDSEGVATQPYVVDEFLVTEQKSSNEDLIMTQTFEMTTHQNKEPPMVIPESEEFNSSREDFIGTQIFPAEEKKDDDGKPESLDATSLNLTERNNEDDFISTQVFDPNLNNTGRCTERNNSDDEDFIATQTVDFPMKASKKCKNVIEPGPTVQAPSRESSPDLLASESFPKDFEDCISTQLFEAGDPNNFPTKESPRRTCIETKENVVRTGGSSGDETESDLEIILDTNEGGERNAKFIKVEPEPSERRSPGALENDNSNSSYVFEVEQNAENPSERNVNQCSDSDATDCEVEISTELKKEPKENVEYEDTQVLTLTPPDNFKPVDTNDMWAVESPKFEVENEPWSPLSLVMPNTQEVQTTVNRRLEADLQETPPKMRKIEVGITSQMGSDEVPNSGNTVDSPLKRPRNSNGGETVPKKKCKTGGNAEKLFLRLVRTHDVAQIQPNRTRGHSLRSHTTEEKPVSVNNECRTSRRKSNPKGRSCKDGDITPYLTRRRSSSGRRRRTETSPKENQPKEECTRVLRSTRKRSGNGNITNGDSGRSCRKEYFNGPCVNIVFTGLESQALDKVIVGLGGKKSNELASGEVVVTDKVRRTVKFLCAIGLGLPITSPEWLLACRKEKRFINPWDFILKDEEAEEKWGFKLKASLEKSKREKFLQGFSIFATESTKPPVKDLLAIVECCGGTPLFNSPDVWPKKTIIVSCLEDKKWWPLAKFRHIKIVHYEFILTGVLTQKVDFKTHKLR